MPDRLAHAALAALIILQGTMLASLYAGVAPHPPASTPLFGMGPFIGFAIAIASAALITGPDSRTGRILCALSALAALLSFGPQKYVDPQFPMVWPAVVLGQISSAALLAHAALGHRLSAA
ncbi:MAG: hypothetical protein AAGA87_05460 [Pseudomonadota bacterium]